MNSTIRLLTGGVGHVLRSYHGAKESISRTRRGDLRICAHTATGIERERRRWPRRDTNHVLWVRWADGENLQGQGVRLMNISRGGALAVTPRPFSVGQVVVVSSGADDRVQVKAHVAGTRKAGDVHHVRFTFTRPCPASIFARATRANQAE